MTSSAGLDRVQAWRGQTESARRQETLRDLHRLDGSARGIEREFRQLLSGRRVGAVAGCAELAPLIELETELNTTRLQDRRQLQAGANKIRAAVESFKKEFSQPATDPDAVEPPSADFVSRAKQAVETIERLVLELKESQRSKYDELTNEERLLAQEVTALDKRIDAWKVEDAAASVKPKAVPSGAAAPATTRTDIADALPPEVAEFERYLTQTGGHTGGWEDVDHRAFLRARQRFEGASARSGSLVDEALSSLPTKTAQQVREHEQWYTEYNRLLRQKKSAIARWRQQKADAAAAAAVDAAEADAAIDSDEEAERRRAERLRQRAEAERRERASELGAWRAEKSAKEKREAEERRKKQAEAAARKAEAERQKQAELRRQADEFRARREAERAEAAEQEARREAEERARRRIQTEADAGRLADRNRQIVDERLARRQQQAEQEEERQRRLASLKAAVEVRAVRDPNRLMQPTAVCRERMAAAADDQRSAAAAGGRPVAGAASMPHRAVPSWPHIYLAMETARQKAVAMVPPRRQWIDSAKKTAFVLGTSLIVFVAARNTATDLLQRFWGASGNYWQQAFDWTYAAFGSDDRCAWLFGTLAITGVVYWAFNLFLMLLDVFNWPKFLLKYKVQPDKNAPIDKRMLAKAVATVLFNEFVVAPPFMLLMFALYSWRGVAFSGELPTFQWVILEIAVFSLTEEVFFYYSHRMLHHPRIYRYVHKIHHEWTAPIGIISLYAHPIEHVLSNLLPPCMGPLIMGSHLGTIWLWFCLALVSTSISHCGYHFPLLPSPEAHDFHHLKFVNNFGVLGILDSLHGTDRLFRASRAYQRHFLLLSLVPVRELYPDGDKAMKKEKLNETDAGKAGLEDSSGGED
uniref:Fatty acid hydroxylase domain-containing protein n=2 Tax=Macrostomum lignano TaxID=282301 RepID=A0A1I8GMH9_9PLAT